MSIAFELVEPFYNWLEEPHYTDDTTEEEIEQERAFKLRPDAPKRAVDAYKKYQALMRDAAIQGVKL
jgi:hypothetical protein